MCNTAWQRFPLLGNGICYPLAIVILVGGGDAAEVGLRIGSAIPLARLKGYIFPRAIIALCVGSNHQLALRHGCCEDLLGRRVCDGQPWEPSRNGEPLYCQIR